MAKPLTATLPEGLVLDAGYTVTLDAVDPVTGAPVAGVVVSAATITGPQAGAGLASAVPPGPYMLVGGPNA